MSLRTLSIVAFALVALGGSRAVVSANSPEASTPDYKTVVEAKFQAWRDRTGSPFELLASHANWTITGNSPMSRAYESREEFLNQVIRPFNARMAEPLTPELRGIYQDGDMVIVHFDAKGIARDLKTYRNTYTWYMRFEAGAVVDVVAFLDTIEFTDLWTRITPAAE